VINYGNMPRGARRESLYPSEGFTGAYVGVRKVTAQNKETPSDIARPGLQIKSGIVLLSHAVTRIVPSALRGLTSLFGMGRGVTPSILTPEETIN
jgi:hypothetical protein